MRPQRFILTVALILASGACKSAEVEPGGAPAAQVPVDPAPASSSESELVQPELPPGPPSTTGVEPTRDEYMMKHWDYPPSYRPVSMKGIKYVESDKGDPAVIGCADGQREGFADVARYPDIAGCVGSHRLANPLDTEPTGQCGDDMPGECARLVNVCATGWHVCGVESVGIDLLMRIGPDDCDNAGPGRFNAAFGHADMETYPPKCEDRPRKVEYWPVGCHHEGPGSEPVCCGEHCEFGECRDHLWKGRTRISRGPAEGCAAVRSENSPGVLCCKDPAYDGDDLKARRRAEEQSAATSG